MIRLLSLFMILTFPVAAAAQRPREVPIDTCRSDPSWTAFRASFNAAIARRDAAALLRLVADDVSGSGDQPGKAAFARAWRLDRSATSRLWHELTEIMRLGCARDRQGLAWVPSMLLDEDAPDDATFGPQAVAVRRGAALRVSPSDSSRIVARLDWDVIWLPEDDDLRGAWVRATLDNERHGFVRRSQIRRLTDYYALFQKQNGQWRLAFLGLGQ